ncbi:MAG: Nucleoside diphosphate kinase [Candidatus Yanofskybacteria bacterium GW2011_GWA1_39_13]|uniref:Nucleoside diphosphate kinase n=1 Tax=Yanofskybacteria sp. (strain GW2011_GWA1_39_13) TaxID=1619019 RepID=A0A0G0PW34_YANXG|nr:MAG: Nucleoside diphosphate kinase [Candidatus Yanofskybacteria bacterium GW2011_GWA1_39_13]
MINTKTEKTLIILKPDAMQRGLMGEILSRFERKGVKFVGLKLVKLSDVLLDKHYAQHKGKHFFEPTKQYMKMMPVVVAILEGMEAVRVVRSICGPTDGKNAPAGTIRGDFSMSIARNIIHSSEDLKSAQREIKLYFKPSELFEYERPNEAFHHDTDRGE